MATERGRMLPIVASALGLATIVFVVLLAWYLNRDTLPSPPASFQAPGPTVPSFVYEVKEAGPDSLVLSGKAGSADIRVARPTAVEVLAPASASEFKVGDWVNVIGIVDEVRNFSIRTIVAIAQHGPAGPDGAGRSSAGFTGLEVRADPLERVLQGGQITAIEGDKITLSGLSGELVVTLTARAPLYRIVQAEPAAVASGDRLVARQALTDGAKPASALAGKLTAPSR